MELSTSTDYEISMDMRSATNGFALQFIDNTSLSAMNNGMNGGVDKNSKEYVNQKINGSWGSGATLWSSYTANSWINIKLTRQGTTLTANVDGNTKSWTGSWVSLLKYVVTYVYPNCTTEYKNLKIKEL